MPDLTHLLHKMPDAAGWLSVAVDMKLKPNGWEAVTVRGGYNSWKISKGGKVFHFRFYQPFTDIEVRRSANGKTIRRIVTRKDVLHFTDDVLSGKL